MKKKTKKTPHEKDQEMDALRLSGIDKHPAEFIVFAGKNAIKVTESTTWDEFLREAVEAL